MFFKKREFKIGEYGEKQYSDETKYPKLELREGGTEKRVLQADISPAMKLPIVTIQEREGAVNYVLPEQFRNWCTENSRMTFAFGYCILPADVIFTRKGDEYSLEVL